MSAQSGGPGRERPAWLIDRDVDVVAAPLDALILTVEPDRDAASTTISLLGTPEWVAADEVTRTAAVALCVIALHLPSASRSSSPHDCLPRSPRVAPPTSWRCARHPTRSARAYSPAAGSGAHEPPGAPRNLVEPA